MFYQGAVPVISVASQGPRQNVSDEIIDSVSTVKNLRSEISQNLLLNLKIFQYWPQSSQKFLLEHFLNYHENHNDHEVFWVYVVKFLILTFKILTKFPYVTFVYLFF